MVRHINDVTETGTAWCGEILHTDERFVKDLNHLSICVKHNSYADICRHCLHNIINILKEAENETENS